MKSKRIEVKNLTKIYKDGHEKIVALDNINFSLDDGESVAIVGPSGSGKSTLLEIMAGLNYPTSGTVEIDGFNVHKGTDKQISEFRNKKLGFVFQLMHLQDYFSVRENIMLPLIAANISKKEADKRVDKLIKMVGLKDRSNHYPKQLSGGEMQRVAIARALSNNPKIIMADEPTGKLDKANAENVVDILFQVADQGVSVIFVTHDERIAKRFSKIIRLDHGKVV